MANYPTKLIEAFASKSLRKYYASAISEKITNQDYEGQVKDQTSILNILTFGALSAKSYTGADLSADSLTESNGQLKTDQAKAFYFTVKSWDKFRSFIKNPEGTILDQTANELRRVIDNYILDNFYSKVAAGNRVGTDYVTGTVAVDSSGNVTGSGTTFTAAMVGRGIFVTGMTKWHRVKTYTSATAIVIEQDLDDDTATYADGAISSGASYTIEAATPIQITKSNVYDYFNKLAEKLDDLEVPEEDRWAAVPPAIFTLIKEAPEFIPSGSDIARSEVVLRGRVGDFAGFTIYKASKQRLSGDKTNGWHIMAGHRSAITFAMGLTENGTEDAIGNFGTRYKSLYVYGAKVVDERRKALTELYAKL